MAFNGFKLPLDQYWIISHYQDRLVLQIVERYKLIEQLADRINELEHFCQQNTGCSMLGLMIASIVTQIRYSVLDYLVNYTTTLCDLQKEFYCKLTPLLGIDVRPLNVDARLYSIVYNLWSAIERQQINYQFTYEYASFFCVTKELAPQIETNNKQNIVSYS